MTRALPGKRPLLVPARLRNPQHFHRLCTGLAPLRTSHPHVCAQAAGKQSCVGWQAAADRHGRRYLYARPARRVRESETRWSIGRPLPGKDRRPPLPGSRRPQVGAKSRARLRPRRHRHDQGVSQPETHYPLQMAAEFYAIYRLLRAFLLLTPSISVRCGPTANRRLLKLNLARLVRQAGKRCYRRRPRRR